MKCPYCSLENPSSAIWCSCGYNFEIQKIDPLIQKMDKELNLLKFLKIIILIFGVVFGILSFFRSFGILMTMTNSDPGWIETYAYFIGLSPLPSVILGNFFPKIGGALLVIGAVWSSILILVNSHKNIFPFTYDDIFWENHGWFPVAATMMTLGLFFLLVGWKKDSLRKIP